MGIVLAAMLIVLGAFAASAVVLGKKPELKETLEKLQKFEGYIGLVGCLWGVWMIISSILNVGTGLKHYPILWVTILASAVLLAGLGFLSGFGMINQLMLGKNEEAKKKAEELKAKLDAVKSPMGLAGMALGVWCLIAGFIL